jgi:serine/threonine protein kinase/Tol biopolymer transport system component
MPLSANARFGPYEIRSSLGAGGMGEVYCAFDTRLNRRVAIKVLRIDYASSPESRSRFEREARAIAALNHPNIVSVYDFGLEMDQPYIVSELIEGTSLRPLLTGQPVSLRKLLDIATQVADGLAAAHAAGFVHRDLKPENIMLTRDGRVKIVDFGLVRQESTAPQSDGHAATVAFVPDSADGNTGTRPGVVLGTPQYMSPEQALGSPADYRSDQFSFGLVLYELASGKQAFAKGSSVETMAAIVRDEPPPMDGKLAAPLRWIIARCLQKEPEQRYESTRDLFQELRNLRDHLSEAHSSTGLTPVAPPRRHRWRIPALCAACFVLAALLVSLLRPSGQNIGNYRYTPFANDTDRATWSPDGNAIAYAAKVNGTLQVFLRYLNSPVPIQLTHEELDTVPFGWSSDRAHLIVGESKSFGGMLTAYALYSVPTVGGQPDFLMDAHCYACDLSRDGRAFATFMEKGVEISDPIGSPFRLYQPDPFNKEVINNPWLSFSPDGKNILLLLPIDGKAVESWLIPYPPGSGRPRPISIFSKSSYAALPSASWMPDGRNLAVSTPGDSTSSIHLWMTNIGAKDLTPLTTGTDEELFPAVSPDGKSILYSLQTTRFDATSVSVENGSAKTLITTGHEETGASWAANLPKLAWCTNRRGPAEIWIRMPDGSERPVVTPADFPGGAAFLLNPAISPDGERIIYVGPGNGAAGGRLWISSVNGGPPVPLTNSSNREEWGGTWSPDGSQFAFLQSDTEATYLMVIKPSGNATPTLLKTAFGTNLPDWSPTGEWITFRDQNGWSLVSPDGKTTKLLGKIHTPYLVFSKSGKLLYGIDIGERPGHPTRATLFSLDPATLKQTVIGELGKDLAPQSADEPGIRFSMAPDGKTFVIPTAYNRADLWILTGYRQPGWRARISEALGLK